MAEKSEEKRVLEEAIRFETDGREFFLKAAEKANTYIAKLIFQTIAQEELEHIRRVKQIYESDLVFGRQEIPHGVAEKRSIQNIFEEAREQKGKSFSVNSDEVEAIRMAVQLEYKGHEFYKRLAQEATSEFARQFYQDLAQEELGHFSTLRRMEEAVTNPTSFG